MQPVLKFTIRNQTLKRLDSFLPVKNSKNYLYAEFVFLTDDWKDKTKMVLFKNDTTDNPVAVILGSTNTCLIPQDVLTGNSFSVSIICGELITANEVVVKLYESGYRQGDIPEPSQSLYEQIMNYFDETKVTAIGAATESESWAHGHTDYPDRDKDNAAYYANEAKNAAASVSGRVAESKKEIDNYVKEKEETLKGETGNVYFAGFNVTKKGKLIMYSDPNVDKVRFERERSRLKYKLAL